MNARSILINANHKLCPLRKTLCLPNPKLLQPLKSPQRPPKAKKMLLIIVAAVVVLGLPVAAGWFFLGKKTAAPEGEEDVPEPVHEVRHGPPTYLPLDNMVVNLADPGGEKVARSA